MREFVDVMLTIIAILAVASVVAIPFGAVLLALRDLTKGDQS